MAVSEIRFDDGASYERYMGTWSRLVGDIFLTWLAPGPGLRWIDIGCGNGTFTNKSSRAAHRPTFRELILLRLNSSLRARAQPRIWRSFTKAMPWRCPSRKAASTPPSWRW